MSPNETASTIPRGPRVIAVFEVHGCCRTQIKHFWGALIGSRTTYGLGLMVGKRLRRMRMRFGHPIALKALELQTSLFIPKRAGLLRELADMTQAPACAV